MTKRALWITDIHLETVPLEQFDAFLAEINSRNPDLVMLTGDIDERTLSESLLAISTRLRVPIYFVLGNHDFYRKTIANVRASVEQVSRSTRLLNYMPLKGIVELTPSIALIGHDGWADGGYGDFLHSTVMLQDYLLIRDLMDLEGAQLKRKLTELGTRAARHIRRYLTTALQTYDHVVVLTHAPPFQEATWYQGQTPADDDDYLPHFSCKSIGDVLRDVVPKFPDKAVTVLCGHTHSGGEAQIFDNLRVITGQAEYGAPEIQQVFELE